MGDRVKIMLYGKVASFFIRPTKFTTLSTASWNRLPFGVVLFIDLAHIYSIFVTVTVVMS